MDPSGQITPPSDLPGACSSSPQALEPVVQLSREEQKELNRIIMSYRRGIDKLKNEGTPPEMTLFDVALAARNVGAGGTKAEWNELIEKASAEDLAPLEVLPGPWQDARTREAQIELLQRISIAEALGYNVHLLAQWQKKYGDQGLSTNIAIPVVGTRGMGTGIEQRLVGRVIVADAADAARLSRVHVRKEGNFEPVLLDGVISTTDNEHWRTQRRHLSEAFMPLSSLAEIMPVSMARAKKCSQRLASMATDGKEVDMSDFFLHEAQAQLQLALLGASEELMEDTNEGIRAAFTGNHEIGKVGFLGQSMQKLMELAKNDNTLGLPTDDCPVRGPLSRAVQTSNLTNTADYGNMLLILFAGHDTTGHTMTWLLFELCRNPSIQLELQAEVDQFFGDLGGRDPTYRDLSRLEFMNRCITETLRMWPAVANGTFRQLQFSDSIKGQGGKEIKLPRGTALNIVNWSRHRNPDLWGADADQFNPRREFKEEELARVGCPMAAANPSSDRFSPFAHSPRNCLGRNFAQMEMRLIMLYLLRDFSFSLGSSYKKLMHRTTGSSPAPEEFRGINRGTMGPMDLEQSTQHAWGTRPLYGMKARVHSRATPASAL
eukprot:TRINITY_DN58262_c0_g1_i1.p1 TRINITY_DN58262_c0_g1~~TRINITY_DN58262_c0_g1_i1.p1  ORF type:complete len:659 (+),score=101.89 TRINITY_DN58262_c0_g1_i1:168-1979(+)